MANRGGSNPTELPEPIPDLAKQFVHYFYRHIRERNLAEIESMYNISFARLSDRYYKNKPWPDVRFISGLADDDHVFCLLYKEMYYRHLYAKCRPTLKDRCESWDNYSELFGLLLSSNVNMQLPNVWLWDMLDEFLYQFQSFCQYRGKLEEMAPEEVATLSRVDDKVWQVLEVLNILQGFVDKSGIVAELEADGGVKLVQYEGYFPDESNVLRMLGYMSLVGLLRVHCLIGDYATGLKAIYPLNLFERVGLFTPKIPGANITLFYYGAFAYLMLRRYMDAARCFNTVLLYVNRVKGLITPNTTSISPDLVLKRNEQMYALLAICVALCPPASKLLDEGVLVNLREKHVDSIGMMSRGEVHIFQRLFMDACPKFVTTSAPDFTTIVNTNQAAFQAQLKVFVSEVTSQVTSPQLKQLLLLYSSISLAKLAALLNVEEAAIRTQLLGLKAKARQLRWDSSRDMTAGSWVSAADLDFFFSVNSETGEEMVNVSDTQQVQTYATFLSHNILRFEEIIRDLGMPALPPAAAPLAVRA